VRKNTPGVLATGRLIKKIHCIKPIIVLQDRKKIQKFV
jgi:hypothetical protein